MAALVGRVSLIWLPLIGVIVASGWRTSPSAGLRRFGRVLAFFSLWAMFNISQCATWGAFRHPRDVGIGAVFALLLAQVAVPWLCAQIIATARGGAGKRHE